MELLHVVDYGVLITGVLIGFFILWMIITEHNRREHMFSLTLKKHKEKRKFLYLDKKLIDVDHLFNGTIDGQHPYVRKWVVLNPKDRVQPDAFYGFDSSVSAEMTALGINLTIGEVLPRYFEDCNAFLSAVEGSDDSIVILVQRSGFFPLAIVLGTQMGETRSITPKKANDLVVFAQTFAIADLN